MRLSLLLILCLGAAPLDAAAAEVRVAVAANFARTCEVVSRGFESRTGHRVTLVAGSTGKHFAQIVNGAPFDVFLAADAERPKRLEEAGQVIDGIRFTYAYGQLALWSADVELVDPDGAVLRSTDFRHLAIANPKLAPYGRAARDALGAMGLLGTLQSRLVTGESVSQVHQFVQSGNADLGFVALSQIKHGGRGVFGSYWEVPRAFYDPIDQQAVLLKDKPAARAFLEFLGSDVARETIREHGYHTP